ncbi:CAMK family protein kinase [Tritrichomonas foetus]|uniref:CAMK family protein kinase n=1 Tax=Tritrichomonas foetus TaxID=1144522 RepID=A0A1J4JZZ0_9EUKA|nr:CAMK family protein kinase [Tritrichomonas foetus]|eukprot:OHT04735.1 CAMK family protein kinase [Tritrichomonas foetus]
MKKKENTLEGIIINGYKLIKQIGSNKYSFVYTAIPPNNGEMRCVKLVHRKKGDNETTAQLFKTEANALTILNHPSIVNVIDYFTNDFFYVTVTEYYKDGSLQDMLQQRQYLSNEEAQQLTFSLALGLQYCHIRNFAHRNLKPSNIVFHDYHPAIVDFSIAVIEEGPHSKLSSLPYIAPEILNCEEVDDKAADIWSFGVILYEVLSGKLPWSATNYEYLLSQIKRGYYTFTPKVNPHARDLISKMMDMSPLHRISSHEIIAHPWLSKVRTSSLRSSKGKNCLTRSLVDFQMKLSQPSSPQSPLNNSSTFSRTQPMAKSDENV